MKIEIITEFVKFKVLESTASDELLTKSNGFINGFLKKQDGFIDAELVKVFDGNDRCFIIHFENLEKLNVIIPKLRNSVEFEDFKSVIVQGSIEVTFQQVLERW